MSAGHYCFTLILFIVLWDYGTYLDLFGVLIVCVCVCEISCVKVQCLQAITALLLFYSLYSGTYLDSFGILIVCVCVKLVVCVLFRI